MFKGKIKVFDKDGNLTKEYPNAYVLSGRYFALEAMFPFERSGDAWLEDLDNLTVRYFEPGSSTDVNGNAGPVGVTYKTPTEWSNGTIYDYNIGTTIHDDGAQATRLPVSVLRRTGRVITIELELDPTYIIGTEVHEVGIFVGNNLSYPAHGPDDAAWDVNDRKNGMIARIIFVQYNAALNRWEADPINCTSAQTVQYEMRMV